MIYDCNCFMFFIFTVPHYVEETEEYYKPKHGLHVEKCKYVSLLLIILLACNFCMLLTGLQCLYNNINVCHQGLNFKNKIM